MAVDALDAVYDLVKKYAYNPSDTASVQLADDQIIRADLNNAIATDSTTEMCIISHNGTIRHGTNHYDYATDKTDTEKFLESTCELLEHIITIDFLCAEPLQKQEVTAERAQIIELLSRSPKLNDFLKSYGFSVLYADNVTIVTSWDDTKNYTIKYSVKLHIGQAFIYASESDYFTGLRVRSASAHNPETRVNIPGKLQTECVDNNHI